MRHITRSTHKTSRINFLQIWAVFLTHLESLHFHSFISDCSTWRNTEPYYIAYTRPCVRLDMMTVLKRKRWLRWINIGRDTYRVNITYQRICTSSAGIHSHTSCHTFQLLWHCIRCSSGTSDDILQHTDWVLSQIWFCHIGPISLCVDLFLFLSVYFRTYLPSVLWHCWPRHFTRENPSPIWPIMCLVRR